MLEIGSFLASFISIFLFSILNTCGSWVGERSKYGCFFAVTSWRPWCKKTRVAIARPDFPDLGKQCTRKSDWLAGIYESESDREHMPCIAIPFYSFKTADDIISLALSPGADYDNTSLGISMNWHLGILQGVKTDHHSQVSNLNAHSDQEI